MSAPNLIEEAAQILAELPSIRDVIKTHNLRADKSLGQHFLLDGNLLSRIVRSAGDLGGQTVVEIGPGPGGLTRALLASPAKKIIAVEMDARCVAALQPLQQAFPQRLEIRHGDAMETRLSDLSGDPTTIIANLPYNIATPLIAQWLEEATRIPSMTLMIQKEVAERIAAGPGSKNYGRISVLSQWRCQVAKLFDVPAAAFVPPPKVVSSIIQLTPYDTPPFDADLRALDKVTKAAFGQRRKMLRGSLKGIFEDPIATLEKSSIDPRRRAEDLSVEQFCQLSKML